MGFLQLPVEIIAAITDNLDVEDILCLTASCKSLRYLCQDDANSRYILEVRVTRYRSPATIANVRQFSRAKPPFP